MYPEQLLCGLGATGNLKGFSFAVHMLRLLEDDPTAITCITKRLYPAAAQHFGVSAAAVERDLRTVVRICWEQPDHTRLERVAGRPLRRRPTNGEFLSITAAYLRQRSQD